MSCIVAPASRGVQARAKSVAETLNLEFVATADDLDSGVALIIDADRRGFNGCKAHGWDRCTSTFPPLTCSIAENPGTTSHWVVRLVLRPTSGPRYLMQPLDWARRFRASRPGCSVALSEQSAPLCYPEQARELALMSANDKVVEAVSRMRVLCGDSRQQAVEGFDVIYIDPMFPERGKTAAVKKDLATVQALHSDSSSVNDPEDLLVWAMAQSVERVVVKRHVKAPALATVKPSHSITGRTVRFDVMVKPKVNGG